MNIRFEVLALGAYPVKQLATGTKIKDEIKIVSGLLDNQSLSNESLAVNYLEVVMQSDDVLMPTCDAFEDCDLISNLGSK
jgi:hypothetical protein